MFAAFLPSLVFPFFHIFISVFILFVLFHKFVMEREREKFNLSIEEVDKQRAPELNINCLPEDIFLEIFGYLDFRERCRIERVCKKWREIARNPTFWNRTSLNISKCRYIYLYHATEKILREHTSDDTCISFNFVYARDEFLRSSYLARRLQERCPNLKTLVLHNVRLDCDHLSDFCQQLPAGVRILVLHNFDFVRDVWVDSKAPVKIEVLDLSHCDRILFYTHSFPTMPHLKKLRLTGWSVFDTSFQGNLCSAISDLEVLDLGYTGVGFMTFQIIRSYAFFLKELYMCNTHLDDRTFIINISEPVLHNLKIICLRHCPVTNKGIISLIEWCQSLEHIYVGRKEINPADDYNGSISEKVHIINGSKRCDHFDRLNIKVDCTCEKDVLFL